MPPKKYNGRTRSSRKEIDLTNRSTASHFIGNDENSAQLENKNYKDVDAPISKNITEILNDSGDNPLKYRFPLNYVYLVQDIMNEYMTFSRFLELACNCYLLQVIYVKKEKFHLQDNVTIIGYNLGACFIAMLLGYKTQLTKFRNNPSSFPKPQLPDFNNIYSILLPLYLNITHKSKFFLINLSLNYFALDNLNIYFNFLSGLAFFLFNNNEEESGAKPLDFILASAVYFFYRNAIQYINLGNTKSKTTITKEVIEQEGSVNDEELALAKEGRATSLNNAEIHLISCAISCLLLNTSDPTKFNLPLIIFQKLIISSTIGLLAAYPSFLYYKKTESKLASSATVLIFSAVVYFSTNYQLAKVINNENAVRWLYSYIFKNDYKTKVVISWIVSLTAVIPLVFYRSDVFTLNTRRKIWHFVLLTMILPPLSTDPQFSLICLLGTVVLLSVVEIVRYNKFTFCGRYLHDKLTKFQDFKDLKGPLNLSYIYLVIGTSIPTIFDYCLNENVSIKAYLGLISLGLGDSVASIIGKRFGKLKWRGSKNTIEGTVAFCIASLIGIKVIDYFFIPAKSTKWESILISILLAGVLEGVSSLNDNFLIPLYVLSSAEVIEIAFQ
ncbi:uncharacterized protein PRCAT00005662001 [Priceomyces carsonii]|uniref:uncharacterized protein n=1 Tax=Priceomyces carsonii TaxID=28549 RepID=UPI002ED78070|nr:unnamed protein product [Priceomyces carsonii]